MRDLGVVESVVAAMMEACPWCEEEYDLTPETEQAHLALCPVFQALPVA